MTKKIFPILLIASFLLSACGTAGSGGVEQTPPAAEPFTQAAPTATAEAAKTPGVDVPVSPEEIAADGELKPVEGDDFQNLRKAFEESPISFYDAATGQLSQSETAGEVGFTVLAANKVSIGGVETGETILFGEYPGGRAGYFVQRADGTTAGTQAWRFAGVDGVEEQVLFVGESGEAVSLSSGARVEPKFGYEYSTETGEVSTFYVFDADGVAHEVPGIAGVGKVAAPPQIEDWYRAAQELREESGAPEEFSWEYTEEGTLQLVRGPIAYDWNEESGLWEQVRGKDYDYAVIENSETRVELDGYPVSIVLGKSVKSKMGDLEFNDPTVFANLMWEVEYQAWLGHKPEAEGKTLAEFKQLVERAKAGDPAALEAITYQTWLNDMDDQAGYKPLPVTVRPLIGGGWTADGVLQPDEIQVVVVNTEKMQNISPQDTLGSGFGFSYMVDASGRIVEVIYVYASGINSDNLSNTEGYLAISLAVLAEIARDNKGKLKLPEGNRLTSQQKLWVRILEKAMELKK